MGCGCRNPYMRDRISSLPRHKHSVSSEKSINKINICKNKTNIYINKTNIYINKTIICTNITFIYSF